MRLAAIAFAAAVAATSVAHAGASPLTRDLGQGLVYWRMHAIPGDLPAASAIGPRPCVLDIRYVKGNNAAATALAGWLKFHADMRAPVFLLANSGTSAALLNPLSSATAVIGLVILGSKSAGFEPDIAVQVAPEAERRAYEALEQGAAIESLVTETVIKSRDDEEALERERDSDATADEAGGKTPAARPPAPTDPVLQRAVQLHRALLALKRL